MALRYSVKKGEILYIEGIRIQFRDDTELLLLDKTDILPNRMIIRKSHALTIIQKFYFEIQEAYITHRSCREEKHTNILNEWEIIKNELMNSNEKHLVGLENVETHLKNKDYFRILKIFWKAIDLEDQNFWIVNSKFNQESENYVKDFRPKHSRKN
jgi:flagellar biosynthesis regulator FlbT